MDEKRDTIKVLISAPHLTAIASWPNGLHHCAIVCYMGTHLPDYNMES
jgi:hypothetical protein